jgi:hypothetical protein
VPRANMRDGTGGRRGEKRQRDEEEGDELPERLCALFGAFIILLCIGRAGLGLEFPLGRIQAAADTRRGWSHHCSVDKRASPSAPSARLLATETRACRPMPMARSLFGVEAAAATSGARSSAPA